MKFLLWGLILAVVVGLPFVLPLAWHGLLSAGVLHWLALHMGLNNPSGAFYLWWSGFGGDLGLFGAVIVFISQRRCEVHRCWRVGRHATAAGHRVCRRHHPEDALTETAVTAAHLAAQDRTDEAHEVLEGEGPSNDD